MVLLEMIEALWFFCSFIWWVGGVILFVFANWLMCFWVFANGFFVYWWLLISVRDLEPEVSDEEWMEEEEEGSGRMLKKSRTVVAKEHKDQLQRLKEKVRYALFLNVMFFTQVFFIKWWMAKLKCHAWCADDFFSW